MLNISHSNISVVYWLQILVLAIAIKEGTNVEGIGELLCITVYREEK